MEKNIKDIEAEGISAFDKPRVKVADHYTLIDFNDVIVSFDIMAVNFLNFLIDKVELDVLDNCVRALNIQIDLFSPLIGLQFNGVTAKLAYRQDKDKMYISKHMKTDKIEHLFIYSKNKELLSNKFWKYVIKTGLFEKHFDKLPLFFNNKCLGIDKDVKNIITYSNKDVNQLRCLLRLIHNTKLGSAVSYVEENDVANFFANKAIINDKISISFVSRDLDKWDNVYQPQFDKLDMNILSKIGLVSRIGLPTNENIMNVTNRIKNFGILSDKESEAIVKLWDYEL